MVLRNYALAMLCRTPLALEAIAVTRGLMRGAFEHSTGGAFRS